MILTCAMLSEAAYDDSSIGFKTIDDLRYGIHDIGEYTFISFRGTDPEELENFIRDARIWPVRTCSGFLAHKGFVRGFQKMCSNGLPLLRRPNVIATGHSMGGAFATLYAEQTGCRAITFGSPRVYWRLGGAPSLDHLRIVKDDDPVTRIPYLSYSHRCDPINLDDGDHSLFVQIKDHSISRYVRAIQQKEFDHGFYQRYEGFFQELCKKRKD